MAKLTARGRYVLVEVVKEWTAEQLMRRERRVWGEFETDGVTPRKQSVIWERVTRRLMSDNKVLEKVDCVFQSDWEPGGRRHSWGWKVHGKAKVTPAEFARIYRDGTEGMIAKGLTSSWAVTFEHPNPAIYRKAV